MSHKHDINRREFFRRLSLMAALAATWLAEVLAALRAAAGLLPAQRLHA